jgi:hypothetical protein
MSVWKQCYLENYDIVVLFNKNVDIKFSVHKSFLE